MKVLALGTYPIRKPIHGGQRRTSQIGAYYRRHGIEYRHACVYDPRHYDKEAVSEHDYPYSQIGGIYSEAPFIDDMGSGSYAARYSAPYSHFLSLIESYRPDVIQIEQPFMWPLVRRLRDDGALPRTRLVYSSHNFEAPLKREILETAGVERHLISTIDAMVLEIETELANDCDLVVAVSSSEADAYRQLNPRLRPMVVRNGSERPGRSKRPQRGGEMVDDEYLYFVGSAYPPNVQGYEKYVLSGTLYGYPPDKRFAVCGGACDGIFQSALYHPHGESYQDRVHFYPTLSDTELTWLRDGAKGVLLPISSGGGSNLKTAEALSSGKWVVATSMALRSFEDFIGEPGVIVADTPGAFQDAILNVIYGAPLTLNAAARDRRERLFWDRLLEESGLADRLLRLVSSDRTGAKS